jgi:hypothetical protein
MATTTNYGWTTPDDTALVKDGASAIRSLGTSIDTTTKNLNPSTTLGDIEYRSSTANTNTRLAIGSTGNVLTVVGGVPAWSAPAGGGKVLQVVSTTYSTATTIASTSLTDTGLTLSITPSSATSKILVCITQAYRVEANSQDAGFSMIVDRSGTTVFDMNQNGYNTAYIEAAGATAITKIGYFAMQYLDSPATTSSRTYKTQARVYATDSSRKVIMNNSSSPASIILMEIGA